MWHSAQLTNSQTELESLDSSFGTQLNILMFRLRAKRLCGRSFGGWHLNELMGAGAFGASFLAHNTQGERAVLKLLRPQTRTRNKLTTFRATQCFSSDAWTECAALQACEASSFTPSWLGIINESGFYFIVLSLCPGTSLAKLLGQKHNFDDAEVFLLGDRLIAALSEIHACGVSHNDLRPANLLYEPKRGALSVIDFGLASFFQPQTAPFARTSLLDRSGLADVLLFLLYSRFDRNSPQNKKKSAGILHSQDWPTWQHELMLPTKQRQFLEQLFADECSYKTWGDIRKYFHVAFG